MELAQDRVQWRGLVLAVLNLRILLPESQLISKMDLREIGCEVGRWMELAQGRVQWRALVLAVLNILVLLPVSYSCHIIVHCNKTSREFVVPHGPPGDHPCIVSWMVMSITVPLSPRVLSSETSAAGMRKGTSLCQIPET
jgi:hypothetical protein